MFKSKKIALLLLLCLIITAPRALDAQIEVDEKQEAKYEPYRDYGEDWRLASLLGLSSEDGILVGTGAILYKFGFRIFPYVYRMELVGGLTLKTARWKFKYTASFPSAGKNLAVNLLAYASELEVRNFYGIGNNTMRDENLEKVDFYRVASRQYFVSPSIKLKLNSKLTVGAGISYKYFEVRQKPNRFLSNAAFDSLGNDRSVTGAGVVLNVDFGEIRIPQRTGLTMSLSAWNYPGLFHKLKPFQRYSGDVRGYISSGPVTLALRAAGEKISGPFPFFEASFLNLRGYNLNRFSGDASLLGTAELRFSLFQTKFLVPTKVGVFIFGDAGRVYVGGNSPNGWHADAGAGISAAPLSPDYTLSVSIASSPEGIFLNGGFGFAF